MKRTELKRRTPLTARTPLVAHKPLQRGSGTLRRTPVPKISSKRAREQRERSKTLAPLREAQTWCSRCGASGVGLDAHELLSRARGGSITDAANIVLLCRDCHDDVTFRHHEIPDADRWVLSRFGGAA